jgi:hypothetical protein
MMIKSEGRRCDRKTLISDKAKLQIERTILKVLQFISSPQLKLFDPHCEVSMPFSIRPLGTGRLFPGHRE